MNRHRPDYGRLLGYAAVLIAAGCGTRSSVIGETGARVKGRLLDNGQPIRIRPGEDVVVSFAPPDLADVTSTRGAASIDPKDGTFTFFGANMVGGLLAPGRYRVSVSSRTSADDNRDRFAATWGIDRSPLIAEVGTEPEQTFVIDIGKKTVTRQ